MNMHDVAGLSDPVVNMHPLAFRNRQGDVHLPLEPAEAIARAFAAAEPETVLMAIQDREEELRIAGGVPGQRYMHDILRGHMPGFAIARHWAGFDKATGLDSTRRSSSFRKKSGVSGDL
jgi:hypothetical protein